MKQTGHRSSRDDFLARSSPCVSASRQTYPGRVCVPTGGDSDRRITALALKKAHARFVLVPIDKASNNVGVICRKYYVQLLNKELGISFKGEETDITGNDTYSRFEGQIESLIQLHKDATLRFCSEPLTHENETIPRLWLTLKCHKNPVKFPFISGARLCTTKQLSVTLGNLLKMFRAHFIRYTGAIEQQRGYSFNWSVNNSAQVKSKIQARRCNGKLTIADFSTLYTAFEHDNIIGTRLRRLSAAVNRALVGY